uniref:Uncharacterized protein n=1 Tax=Meloidogyne enterolobii TaxID=390850 RepID=A0A6V7TWY9_MELEN|nr:unnamed protein product [Meloidogyne enterolobii]
MGRENFAVGFPTVLNTLLIVYFPFLFGNGRAGGGKNKIRKKIIQIDDNSNCFIKVLTGLVFV